MMAARLPGDRLHLQHGPIDLVIGAEGGRARAFEAAVAAFDGLLERLVEELPALRSPAPFRFQDPVARRMDRAVAPYRRRGFVTPMAAVAGAVADEVLAAMTDADVRRAYVNNGGDIALHLAGDARFESMIAAPEGGELGRVTLCAADAVGGMATSGRGGRSLSMGIADSVTVLAASAAQADVAATWIANAVDVPGHSSVRRVPACDLDPQSDLGVRRVVTSVGALTGAEVRAALDLGAQLASKLQAEGLIRAAALFLRGQSASVGEMIRSLADA